MLSIMQIDGIAKRYGRLPSEVLKDATTFDLYILDAALTYEQYHQKKAMNKGQDPAEYFNSDQLLEMTNNKHKGGPYVKTKR